MACKLDPSLVIQQGERQGWDYTGYQAGQGQLVFLERRVKGSLYSLHVWCTTGTVGSYLDHPHQGKTQLYRRNADMSGLRQILQNPRVHTGDGYHQRPQPERTVACPGCGRKYASRSSTASHFESGSCSSCPGRDAARQAAYAHTRQIEQSIGMSGLLTNGGQMALTYDANFDVNWSEGYQQGGLNYKCPGCRKGFKTCAGMHSHMEARPQCAQQSESMHMRQALGY